MSKIVLPYNMDRSERLVIETESLAWVPSPNPQVLRKPLEREKEESGQVTSVVEYVAGSKFPTHKHPLGEEIYVLEGEFADENGRYPKGTYIRNPPGSKHSPFSEKGCKIFVKLNQFAEQDLKQLCLNTHNMDWLPGQGQLRVMPLHDYEGQNTALVHWPKGTTFQPHKHWGGEEIFVLEGTFQDEYGDYPKGTWLRSPHLSTHNPYSEEGCTILVKTGGMLPPLTKDS